VPAAAAVSNAVCNALAAFGIRHVGMPITAEKIWAALHEGAPAGVPQGMPAVPVGNP
jgi:carbon-monoxide dehydrogenase large subunit